MAKFYYLGKTMQIKKITFISILLILLTSCASYDFSRRPVQQGNLLPEDKIARLKVGMSKDDVITLMGNSLLSPVFTNDRWDYAYTWRRGNSSMQKKSLALYFKNNTLVRIERII